MRSVFLRYALRNILRNKLFTLINLGGLSVAVTSCVLIGLWTKHEFSYDRYIPDWENIFRVTVKVDRPDGYHSHYARCSQDWILQMPENFPGIRKMARLYPLGRTAIQHDEVKFYSENAFRCNPEMIRIFDLDFILGDPKTALNNPGSVLLAESLVEKYFHDPDVIGKQLKMAGIFDTEFKEYNITGIFRDFSEYAHLHPSLIISLEDPQDLRGSAYTYFLLNNQNTADHLIANFQTFAKDYLPEDEKETSKIFLQNISDIHLYSNKDREIEKNGNIRLVISFLVAGLLILVLAITNFINLNLVQSIRKQKNFMVTKILGAGIKYIFLNIFLESMVLGTLIFIISCTFLTLTGKLTAGMFPSHYLSDNWPAIYLLTGGMTFLISVINTLVLFLSLLKPLRSTPSITSGKSIFSGHKSMHTRKILIIFQFTISIVLLTSAIFVNQQKNFMLSKRMGGGKDAIVVMEGFNWAQKEHYYEFKSRLLENTVIKSVTGIMEEPSGNIMDAMPFEMSGISAEKKDLMIHVLPADDNFIDFFNLRMLAGRNFRSYNPDLKEEDYIINETALQYLGFDDPETVVGRKFKLKFPIDSIFFGGKICGVVKDFNFSPLRQSVKPLVIFQKPIWYWVTMAKVDSSNINGAIRFIHKAWTDTYPEYLFDYTLMNDLYDDVYSSEINQSKFSRVFTLIAVLIAILGLFGITSITIELRTREIGIRKVIGANFWDVIFMLQKEITIWIFIAILIATPFTWIILKKWSQTYAYHPSPSWSLFFITGIITMIIAWITVSYKSIRAALTNPATTLKYE